MAEQIADEFREAMSNWVRLKKQLASAREDIKILNNEEKKLKEFIKNYMKNQEINVVNLKKGKVTLRKTMRKAGLSRDAVEEGLSIYFQGDEVRVEAAMTCIYDNLSENAKESEVISLTGLNKKNDD